MINAIILQSEETLLSQCLCINICTTYLSMFNHAITAMLYYFRQMAAKWQHACSVFRTLRAATIILEKLHFKAIFFIGPLNHRYISANTSIDISLRQHSQGSGCVVTNSGVETYRFLHRLGSALRPPHVALKSSHKVPLLQRLKIDGVFAAAYFYFRSAAG